MRLVRIGDGPYLVSARSRAALDTLHPDLRLVIETAMRYADFTVLEGHRDEARQNLMKREGKSQLAWPHSKHNGVPSHAVDVAPWPIDWSDNERFVLLAGIVMGCAAALDVPLRWGGDWDRDGRMRDERFRDLGHFELDD